MKASYHGHKFEVDSVIGKDGMEYPAQDVVLIEPDWSSFRREAAKDILCAMVANNNLGYYGSDYAALAKSSISLADELIAKLKEK